MCAACSTNKKYLSKDATEKFRVCDMCDTKLDNMRLKLNYETVIKLKDEKIELIKKLLVKLKEQKIQLNEEI